MRLPWSEGSREIAQSAEDVALAAMKGEVCESDGRDEEWRAACHERVRTQLQLAILRVGALPRWTRRVVWR